MKRKKLKKAIALATAVTMTMGTLSGCGNAGSDPTTGTTKADNTTAAPNQSSQTETTTSQTESTGITYPIANAGSFTYGMSLATAWSDRYDSYDALPLGKALEEQTGFDMKMVHVQDKTAMNLLLASGELPDAITYNFASNYTGGNAKAYSDGIIYSMSEEFMQENAPDYWAYLQDNPQIYKQVKADDNTVYGFGFILGGDLLKAGQGIFVREDWLTDLGLEAPETPEEFKEMLKQFKEKKGAEIPFEVTNNTLLGLLKAGDITSAFGLVCMDPYQVDGKVHIGYAEPEFKDVLAYLNELYTEGLLDPNFATVDSETVTANMLTGVAGATDGAIGSVMGTLLTTNADVKGYSLIGIKNLVAKRGDTPMFGKWSNDVPGNMTVITNSCKDPATVAKFFNYGFTEAGHLLYNFGIEGESFEYVGGEPIFTELITNNPNGLTLKQALSEYQLAWTNGPFIQDPAYLLQYYSDQRQKDALTLFSQVDAAKYKYPAVTIPTASASKHSSLTSELETYRDEMIIKYIRGEESLDTFDSYLNTLNSMGLEELIQIKQEALDAYNAQ